MPTERPKYDHEKMGAMGLFNLYHRAQEQQCVEDLSSSHGRWTVVGGFRRYDVDFPSSVNLDTIDNDIESRIPESYGFFVKREYESGPTMNVVKDGIVECLDGFLERMKGVNRFELFTGKQRIFDVREKSCIVYCALSEHEIALLYRILSNEPAKK
ncbi:hypothetical protein HY484_02580 [Candidatus Woesearchaeota archaeon]|nr:hypothetical protein [Candidatus Woesearchaeota archaeon]